jgi:hypothetical protein
LKWSNSALILQMVQCIYHLCIVTVLVQHAIYMDKKTGSSLHLL